MDRENEIYEVMIDDIIPNRFQPRLSFDEKALNELADSIKEHGIIQPLVLRKIGDKYEIIAGERRYKASTIAGLTKVPSIILNVDDNKSAELAIVENLQRKQLSAIEEAQSYKKLLDKKYLSQEELAKRLGISQSTVANKLRLLNLPNEVQNALLENKISERHARSLLSLKDGELQIKLLDDIIRNRLTVKQTDLKINEILAGENTGKMNLDINSKETELDINKLMELQHKVEPIEKKETNKKDLQELKPIEITPEDDIKLGKTSYGDFEEMTFNSQLNPFQEPEVLDFTSQKEISPKIEKNNDSISSLTEEFDKIDNSKKIKKNDFITVINATRGTIKEIEEAGFDVDTEEFDFEDMYQIIIKIQK